jgi:hypothetical protein
MMPRSLALLTTTLLATVWLPLPTLTAQEPHHPPAAEKAKDGKSQEGKSQDKKDTGKKDAGKKEAAAKIDFAAQIFPILEARCIGCHSTPTPGPDGRMKKPKGGVVLDSKDGITQSKKGKVLAPRKPEDSLLYTLIVKPENDEDRMPTPKAKDPTPLPKEQTDLIKEWIAQGADFGTWTSAHAPAEAKATDGKADGKPGEKPADKPKDKPADKPKG